MGSIQKGALIAKNDNGTLQHVDNSSTFIGTATLPNGKVVEKRFRDATKNGAAVKKKWEEWQKKTWGKEEEMEREQALPEKTDISENEPDKVSKLLACPLLGGQPCLEHKCMFMHPMNERCSIPLLGSSLWYIAQNFARLDNAEMLELIAVSVDGLKSTVPAVEIKSEKAPVNLVKAGLEAFFEGKNFIHFVNMHSKNVHGQYKAFCKEHGYEAYGLLGESELAEEIQRRYLELYSETTKGGRIFLPKGV